MKERHLEILKLVNERERVSVKELSQVLGAYRDSHPRLTYQREGRPPFSQ